MTPFGRWPGILAACEQGPVTAAFVGDSLTLGTASTDNVGFVGYVTAETGWQAQRYVWYHLADSIVRLEEVGKPDIIVLELGIQALHGSDRLAGVDDELFRRYYGLLLDEATGRASTVIVVNIPWLDWGPEKAERAQLYNQIIAEQAAQYGAAVADVWAPMQTCGLACIGEDNFHPNDEGHRLIAEQVLKAIPAK
jgi:GDSL-like Lipase/Acylhydrolase family